MNELQKIFKYSNVEVRTVIKDGEPWFVAKDICDILEHSNTTMAIEGLDEDERAKFNLGRQGDANIISESGLYSLIFSSRKAEAKTFRRWVTHKVLPAIRKTGKYETPDFLGNFHTSIGQIRALSWHATPTTRKQHVNDNIAKLKEYYHGLIDSDVASEPEPISIFIKECCSFIENSLIDRTPLYDAYTRWSITNNTYPLNKAKFTRYLGELDEVAYLSPDRCNGLNARFAGIKLEKPSL